MSGDDELTAYIARLRGLNGAIEAVAIEAAPLVEDVIKATASAGTDGEGRVWPTKKDGSRALPNAADAVSVEANGNVIISKVVGGESYHQKSKGKRRRLVLPDGGAGIPPPVVDAVKIAVSRVLARLMR